MNSKDKAAYLYNKFGEFALEVAKEVRDSNPSELVSVPTINGIRLLTCSKVRYWNNVIKELKKMM